MIVNLDDNMPVTYLHLNISNSVSDNALLVGLMAYIDDMMGLDYDNIAMQLRFAADFAEKKAARYVKK